MARIIIGIAEMRVAKSPETLVTLGLGSCVGLVLYDAAAKIGGMVHIMLPTSKGDAQNKAKYADTGIDYLLEHVLKMGANRNRLFAKLAGGANMFGTSTQTDILRIGERNVCMCHQLLQAYHIPVKAEETGGNTGRTIEFSCDTGHLKINTAWPRAQRII
jgi:chemotaxis protein CheD